MNIKPKSGAVQKACCSVSNQPGLPLSKWQLPNPVGEHAISVSKRGGLVRASASSTKYPIGQARNIKSYNMISASPAVKSTQIMQ